MQSRCGIKSLVLVLGAAGLLTACGSAPNCGSATGATVSRDMDRKATKKATPTPVPTPPTPPPITPPAAAPTPTPTPVPAGAITQRSPLDQSSECPTATSNKCTNNLYDGSCS